MTHAAAPPFESSTKEENPEIGSPLFIKQSTLTPISGDLVLDNKNVKGRCCILSLAAG
jgi:hypothetical protein